MIEKFLEVIAPHSCCNCGQIGNILCVTCLYSIASEPAETCLRCQKPALDGACGPCASKIAYSRGWVAGVREAALEELINRYKFSYAKAAYKPLADLLDVRLPVLPADTIIVPIPTIPRHIRQRGYDHTKLIATQLARCRRLSCQPILRRQTVTVQREAVSAPQRRKQAAEAFKCPSKLEGKLYLIVDDVITTGSTIEAAARCLKQAGAQGVWVAAIAQQPLDSRPRR